MALVLRLILGLTGLDRGADAAALPLVPPPVRPQDQGSFSTAFSSAFDIGSNP